MGIKRHKPEEIVMKLRQVEVLIGKGRARIDAIRQISITEQPTIIGVSDAVACERINSNAKTAQEGK